MPTNNYPGVGKITQGRDYNFFQKVTVTATDFGSNSVDGVQPDLILTIRTAGIMFLNEDNSSIVEYSFNGVTAHGELNPALSSRGITFDNRIVSKIWFRLKTGSSAVVRVDAWSKE